MCRHLVEHLFSFHVLSSPDSLQVCGSAEARNVNAHDRPENEVCHIGGSPLLFYGLRSRSTRANGCNDCRQKYRLPKWAYVEPVHCNLPLDRTAVFKPLGSGGVSFWGH